MDQAPPRYLHKAPPLDHMPPAFAHCCSGEGSEPGCEIVAQPAKVNSTHSSASPVAAILTIQLAWRRIAWQAASLLRSSTLSWPSQRTHAGNSSPSADQMPVVVHYAQGLNVAETGAVPSDTATRDAALDIREPILFHIIGSSAGVAGPTSASTFSAMRAGDCRRAGYRCSTRPVRSPAASDP
jgi:hypothetical protein